MKVAVSEATPPAVTTRRILVIDDEYPIVDALVALLSDEGFVLASAGDGRAGLAVFSTFKPHLVICDVMMPVMGGFELLQVLRALPGGRELPVIFMSAVHSLVPVDDPRVAMLHKPFEIENLLKTIADFWPA